MSEVKPFLENIHIQNYLSLRDVELPLKPLTVLVGPNASGKSNILSALDLLNEMIIREELLPTEAIRHSLWAGGANHFAFKLQARVGNPLAVYDLVLKADADESSVDEELLVNDVQVISIQSGQGIVQDEDGTKQTKYKSNKLALKSAGNYGNKPVTNALAEFIKGWIVFDILPARLRGHYATYKELLFGNSKSFRDSPLRGDNRWTLSNILSDWYENDRELFDAISKSLAACTNFRLDLRPIDGDDQLCLLEKYDKPIPLEKASGGTLCLIAYYILLRLPEPPPLIAIEEPERNLHPGALANVANVLEQLAERTQVIITTHSSQLLDVFNPEKLSDSLGVLLLRNPPKHGTEVINLEDIRGEREALDGWISDFGIGSAIFESELLQEVMED